VPRVIEVLTHENAPAMKPAPKVNVLNVSTAASGTYVRYLATDEVYGNCQPVAVVVAETSEAARYAASLVRPAYQELPAVVDFAAEEPNTTPQKKLHVAGERGRQRRREGSAGGRAGVGGHTVHHAAAQLQRHRTARHHRCVER
jgi:CO/xanthine dehydrogenase Mo-binding subunit